jgi:hypothetical protein
MKKIIITGLALSLLMQGFSQASVGIGTTSPNSRAILDLNSTTQVFLPPRMSTQQMGAIASPPLGSLIYNNDIKRYMAYTNTHFNRLIFPNVDPILINVNKWLPLSTGPKVLAWGSMDSSTGSSATYIIAPIKAGSGNFEIRWYKNKNGFLNNWYELVLTNDNFELDSMLLIVTPVGNASWDMAVAIGQVVNGSQTVASIKFIDISRSVSGWSSTELRRRSKFHFVLYDLRGY